MPHTRAAVVFTILTALAASAAEPLPSADDLQSMADKKDWPGVLAAVTRILPLKGPATAGYDRADLWMKKGEAQLQSKQFIPASQSFAKVADEPKVTPEQSDLATALSELSKKSDAKGYKTPAKSPGGSRTLDVFDPAKRADAFAALFAADAADLDQRVVAAKAAVDAKPLIDLEKSVAELRPLDRVVNKSTDKSDAIEKTLAGQFVDSVAKATKPLDTRLDEIKTAADEQIQERTPDRYGHVFIRERKRGVPSNELTEIRNVMKVAEKMAAAYTDVEKRMAAAGKDAIKPAKETIQSTYDKAKALQTEALKPPTDSNTTGRTIRK